MQIRVLLIATLPLFGAAPGRQLEPKLPLSSRQELKLTEDEHTITVSGETFRYIFGKENGLLSGISVLNREITGDTPIPDLMLAERFDPSQQPYFAHNEKQGRAAVLTSLPSRAVVRGEGRYTADDGTPFPLRYTITYDIGIDGVVLVQVENHATGPCSFRWLSLSAGAVTAEFAKFLNWMPEQSLSQVTRYEFRPLADQKEEKILGGVWLPWIWIGDQDVGLEITTWDVSSQTYSRLDSSTRDDQHEMFTVRRENGRVRWENFLVRRTRIFADTGWKRSGQFALAVTPSKSFDPYFAMVKGAHLGPHQHVEKLNLPAEGDIRTLAQNGYNLVVGMANWRSGEYVPLNEEELRRTIDTCHKYGVKIIPYVTLVDLSHATKAWREHGEEWAIEPTTEFAKLRKRAIEEEFGHNNDAERETTLMCPGAEGWREHWKRQIDRVVRDYDFDGIYFDFWYGRMTCENSRHGCGGRFRRHTVLGSREMLVYAYNRIKAKNQRAIIKGNTNTLATALITSVVDLRLVGESTDATKMDPDSRQWLYTSHRLGEPTEFLWANTQWNAAERAGFAALVNFLPQYYRRPKLERVAEFDDFDVYRSFDDGSGAWSLGISGRQLLRAAQSGVAVNVVERDRARLVTLINTTDAAVTAELPVEARSIAFEPLSERLESPVGVLRAELATRACRHFIITRTPAAPRVLSALGAQRPAEQSFGKGHLRFSAEAVEGARIRYFIYSPIPIKKITNARGQQVTFEKTAQPSLVRLEVMHVPDEKFTAWF